MRTQNIPLDVRGSPTRSPPLKPPSEFDAYARTYAGHRTVHVEGGHAGWSLAGGTKPIMLAAAGRPVEAGTLDALAGVVAIAIERAPP